MSQFKMTIGSVAITAELFSTPTTDAIYDSVSFLSSESVWGEEVYFSTPVSVPLEPDAPDIIKAGELAFGSKGVRLQLGMASPQFHKAMKFDLRRPRIIGAARLRMCGNPSTCLLGATITVEEVD